MPKYQLRVDVLIEAALRRGDTNQSHISRRTGIDKTRVSRLMNGGELSLDNLMRFSATYDVSANSLAETMDEAEVAA